MQFDERGRIMERENAWRGCVGAVRLTQDLSGAKSMVLLFWCGWGALETIARDRDRYAPGMRVCGTYCLNGM